MTARTGWRSNLGSLLRGWRRNLRRRTLRSLQKNLISRCKYISVNQFFFNTTWFFVWDLELWSSIPQIPQCMIRVLCFGCFFIGDSFTPFFVFLSALIIFFFPGCGGSGGICTSEEFIEGQNSDLLLFGSFKFKCRVRLHFSWRSMFGQVLFCFGLVLFGLLYEIRDFKFGFHKSWLYQNWWENRF